MEAAAPVLVERDKLDALVRDGWGVLGALAGTAAGCLAATIILVPAHLTSTDLRQLLVVCVLGGALGGSTSAIVSVVQRLQHVLDAAHGKNDPTSAAVHEFGRHLWPGLIVRPLLGGITGLIMFAGFVGGFLVATTDPPRAYSPAGLLFLAVLAGLFANPFLARLRIVFNTLLGFGDDRPAAPTAPTAPAADTASPPAPATTGP